MPQPGWDPERIRADWHRLADRRPWVAVSRSDPPIYSYVWPRWEGNLADLRFIEREILKPWYTGITHRVKGTTRHGSKGVPRLLTDPEWDEVEIRSMTLLFGTDEDVRIGEPLHTLDTTQPIFVQLELRAVEPGVRLIVMTDVAGVAKTIADHVRPKKPLPVTGRRAATAFGLIVTAALLVREPAWPPSLADLSDQHPAVQPLIALVAGVIAFWLLLGTLYKAVPPFILLNSNRQSPLRASMAYVPLLSLLLAIPVALVQFGIVQPAGEQTNRDASASPATVTAAS